MRLAWAVIGLSILGGCQFQQEFELYCRDTGNCRCTDGDCCAEFAQECGSLGCCDGMTCGSAGVCEGTVNLVFYPQDLQLRSDDLAPLPTAHLQLSNLGLRNATGLSLQPQGDVGLGLHVDYSDCGGQLAPGATCDVQITFAPTAAGSQQLNLIASAAGNTGTAKVFARAGKRLSLDYQPGWEGSIHSEPAGIACPGTCELYVPRGTTVTLRDDGAPGVRGIVGPPCGDLPCTVVVDDDLTLSATLVPLLTVTRHGPYSGETFFVNSQACGDINGCSYALTGRTEIALDALSVVPWTSGPCAGQEPGCVFDLVDPVTVDIHFEPLHDTWWVGMRPIDVGPNGAEADIRCNGGIAWVFTPTRDPRTVLASRGWNAGTGVPFIDRLTDVVSGRVQSPVGPPGLPIISGLQPGGALPASSDVCGNFMNAGGTMVPGTGGLGGTAWYHDAAAAPLGCSDDGYVLCFGQGPEVRVVPPYGSRRLAFLSAPWKPSGGLPSADAFCQGQATGAGLPGTYRALLAPSGGYASDRFTVPSGREWKTVTEVRVVKEFATPTPFPYTPYVNVTADGGVVQFTGNVAAGDLVWSDEFSIDDLDTCTSWLGGSSLMGRVRRPESTGHSTTRVSCSTAQRMVCLQDE